MEALDRRPATVKEFAAAVKLVLGDSVTGIRYADKTRSKDASKRYVAMYKLEHVTKLEIHNVEAALWMLGATANTRRSSQYIRGTCVIA
jgi:hypothetical protein